MALSYGRGKEETEGRSLWGMRQFENRNYSGGGRRISGFRYCVDQFVRLLSSSLASRAYRSLAEHRVYIILKRRRYDYLNEAFN